MPHGKLTVVVEKAVGIKDVSEHGRGRSYCTLQCGSQVLRTDVAEGAGSHPVFHTELEFEIDRSTNDLVISVLSSGFAEDYELVGWTTLDFKAVFLHGHSVPLIAYPLSRSSGNAGGHINISLKFRARPSPYAQAALMRPHSTPAAHVAPAHAQTTATARNDHREASYEGGNGSSGSGSSESSRSSGRRSGDRPDSPLYKRAESEPQRLCDNHAGASSYENRVHHRPGQPSHAQPWYPYAGAAAHQAIPNHRGIPVNWAPPGPPQPVAWQQQPAQRPKPPQPVARQQQPAQRSQPPQLVAWQQQPAQRPKPPQPVAWQQQPAQRPQPPQLVAWQQPAQRPQPPRRPQPAAQRVPFQQPQGPRRPQQQQPGMMMAQGPGTMAGGFGGVCNLVSGFCGDGNLGGGFGRVGNLVSGFGRVDNFGGGFGGVGNLVSGFGGVGNLVSGFGGVDNFGGGFGGVGNLVSGFGGVGNLVSGFGGIGDFVGGFGGIGNLLG